MITLLNTHFSSSGSMSLWSFLNNHPQIISSRIKEPVDVLGWNNIFDQWPALKNGNVYVEATPHLYTKIKYNFLNIRETLPFTRYCTICVLGNHIDYLISLVTKDGFHALSKYINSDGLYVKQLDMLADRIGRENMFIVNLKDIENHQQEIYDFLNVDPTIFFRFPRLNSFLDKPENRKEMFQRRKKIIEKIHSFSIFIEKDKKELKEKYGIGELK